VPIAAVLNFINLVSTFGVSVIGTNLLSHRYLHAKASVMITLLNDDQDPSVKWLKSLEAAFVWEARALYVVVVGVPLLFINNTAGLMLAALTVMAIVLMDTSFSVLVTVIFLRPLFQVLSDGQRAIRRSRSHQNMQQTMRMTLFGSTLTVTSSTVLYVDMVLQFTVQGRFHSSPWLNTLVFGINLDSILNDVGMMIVSGALNPNASDGSMSSSGILPSGLLKPLTR
jgi:hypothetical protein